MSAEVQAWLRRRAEREERLAYLVAALINRKGLAFTARALLAALREDEDAMLDRLGGFEMLTRDVGMAH